MPRKSSDASKAEAGKKTAAKNPEVKADEKTVTDPAVEEPKNEPAENGTGTQGAAETAPETNAPAQPEKNAAEPDEKDRELELLRAQVAAMQAQMEVNRAPQVIQVMADTEKVTLRFQSECAPDNVATFGPGGMYGQVTGQTGTLTVPKAEWSRFLTEQVRFLINSRQLIVLSGLTDDERVMYNADYKEGEVLDQMAFTKLLDMGWDLVDVFPKLCRSHQEMVASRFLTASMNGDPRASDRELIKALNVLSQENGQAPLFNAIIVNLNQMDVQ